MCPDRLGPGDLCTVEFAAGEYRVVKILAMSDGIVHVRLYADRFGERPFQVDPAQLDQGPTDRYFGIRHMPVSADNFGTWRPGAVGHEDVRADELEGYEIWQEAFEARVKPGLLGRR